MHATMRTADQHVVLTMARPPHAPKGSHQQQRHLHHRDFLANTAVETTGTATAQQPRGINNLDDLMLDHPPSPPDRMPVT